MSLKPNNTSHSKSETEHSEKNTIGRRAFLKGGGATLATIITGCNTANGKAEPVAVPPATASGPVAQTTDSVRKFLQGAFPDSPEIQEFCERSLEDPSSSVGGSLTDRGEQWRVLKVQGGLGEEFTACTGEELRARQVGTETEVCDSHGNCAILDENFGQPLTGTFTGKDGSLKRNPVGEIAYERESAAEVGGLRSDNTRLTTENAGLREQITQLEGQKAALELRIAEREQRITELEQAGLDQQGAINNLKKEIETLGSELAEVNRQLEECQKKPMSPRSPRRGPARPRPAARPAPAEAPSAPSAPSFTPSEDDGFERTKKSARDRVRHLRTDESYLGTESGTDTVDDKDDIRTYGL